MKKILIVLVFSAITLSYAWAVPPYINFQGVLKDNSGNLLTGSYSIKFSIYNGAAGGSDIWHETQTVSVEGGLYNVQLGSATALGDSAFSDGATKYLGITVGADTEMSPRVVLVSVPYAYRAAVADSTGGVSAEGFVQLGPASWQTTSSHVGINLQTTDPAGFAIYGSSSSGHGVEGVTDTGWGAAGIANGGGIGVHAHSINGIGIDCFSLNGTGEYSVHTGVSGVSPGVLGETNSVTGTIIPFDPAAAGVVGRATATSPTDGYIAGVRGISESTNSNGIGVYGSQNGSGWGVHGVVSGSGTYTAGVAGIANATSGRNMGIFGLTYSSDGYAGYFDGGSGVRIPVKTDAGPPSAIPDNGTMIYNTNEHKLYIYDGGWRSVSF